ncbi:hypothetical protein Leryth_021289 [Lithospermum erythrorhizon]|nr:hypothetical protein Leryth_021289 [Lithospermum erythrorhizon]
MVVGISPIIWLLAVLCLMSYTHGWYSYYWLPFYPLIVLLLVGTKLQMIITKMGLRIQDRGDIVKGTPMVKPGDDLFWFNRPRLMLFLIQFVLFQNAFQLAFFAWSWYEFGLRSCFHDRIDDILIRVSMGILTQVLCSYVTLPLYALVTQMGSKMKPVIFSDNVASALRSWHQTAKKHIKQGQLSGTTTPFWSRPPSPLHGMSPLHLLHGYQGSIAESLQTSPRMSNYDNEGGSLEGSQSPPTQNNTIDNGDSHNNNRIGQKRPQFEGGEVVINNPSSSTIPHSSRPLHEIEISLSDFSFVDKKY